jgi:hypothetical protein
MSVVTDALYTTLYFNYKKTVQTEIENVIEKTRRPKFKMDCSVRFFSPLKGQ